ncbi:hypothetical protein SAMN05216474_1078 [Lishizhenia tianjinensis]|uniref:Uncharacterized protein n=1 Tax=Lishizhenia tianjinensis TaxID=477690 RepID=A0A1I6YPY0_9FLAO|nr:hypothetical protein [Lishizhenia tianjinensis]SFT52493.1 hypothetical protein SAMN05216474_1078 [Lishizhenia tianjinensis]
MKLYSILFLAALALFSCKKEIEESNSTSFEQPSTKDYLITTAGSYWVYDNYKVDGNGVETSLNTLDTIKCLGTEVIEGKEYAVFYRSFNPYFNLYLRDSNGYVIDQHGKVNFSMNKVGEVFSSREISGLINEEVKVASVDQDLSTQAGAFETVHIEAKYSYLDGTTFNACGGQSVALNTYYTKGVGKVWMEYGYIVELENTCSYRVRKLKEYSIAK